jgi:hypothetical protein
LRRNYVQMAKHDQNRDQFENENNAKLGGLHEQVSMLKELTLDINDNVNEQNTFLDGMVNGLAHRFRTSASSLIFRRPCRATVLIRPEACWAAQ